jgi:acyl-CoA synthetase (AMP-forming)/AMP-acid ligase II
MTLAAHSLGACVAELNPETSKEMLGAIAQQTGARFAAFAAKSAPHFGALDFERVWVQHPTSPSDALLRAAKAPVTWLHEDGTIDGATEFDGGGPSAESDVALLVYTSGSTGRPRAVAQTHRNLRVNTQAIVRYLELTSKDRACLILPLSYCYGRSVLWTHLYAGASVFLDNRFMYPRVVLEAIGTECCTGFAGVPLTFELLRKQLDVTSIPMSSLRYLTQAGGAMRQDTIDWVRKAFSPAKLWVMYGQTEATARLSYLDPHFAESKQGSVGRAVDGIELAIKDDTGRLLGPLEVGHVVVSGGSVMQGYYRDPSATAEVLRDGELWTGDQGYLDADGFLFLVGRCKEIMKLGGHRVSAKEIEEAIAQHPEVAEVAVAGEPDEVAGEIAVAFVVAGHGFEPSADDIKRTVRERLPAFKVPRDVVFVDSLPRTATGKVARSELHKLRKVTA